ncbi:uncharacterized protein [Scyliorhinus torazame]|uniref:uncharacterized protein n=1 Tax=Scyliorhinus torazame TaxID=75743 RepID=UPI003B5B6A25
MIQEKKKDLNLKRKSPENSLIIPSCKKRKKVVHNLCVFEENNIDSVGMSSGRKKQILSLLKWRKGKKGKTDKAKAVIPDDLDIGSCQPKQTSSLFGRSQSEDSGLDLSNSSCLFQRQVQSDTQENASNHSRHTSSSSGLYSYLSYDSCSALFPRTHSFTALSGGEHQFKAAASSSEEDDDFFGLKEILQMMNAPCSFQKLTEPVEFDFTVTDVTKNGAEEEEDHKLNSNNWRKEKWRTQEEFDILGSQQAILGFHEQVKRSSLECKDRVPRAAAKGMGIGILYRICSMMEKITELERDRLELLRQNNELQNQLSQSQQAEATFLRCCTCGAGPGLNISHTIPQRTTCSRQMVTRTNPITEIKSRLFLGPPSEANTGFEQSNSSQHKFIDIPPTFTHISPETLNLGAEDDLQFCVSKL